MSRPSLSAPHPTRTALALAAAALLVACGESGRAGDADLQVRWSFEPSPPRVGTAEVRLEMSVVDWTPRNGATVVVRGLRDGVELVVDTARGQGAGLYVAPEFRFEVAGDCVLRARVETTDRRWVEVERTVAVESEPGRLPGIIPGVLLYGQYGEKGSVPGYPFADQRSP